MELGSVIQSIDYAAIAPVLAVLAGATAVLLADLIWPARRALPAALSVASLAVALAFLLPLRGDGRGTFCVPGSGGSTARPDLGSGGPRACSYVVDDFTLVLQLVVLAGALAVVLLSARTVADEALPGGEYHLLLLFSVSGAVTLAASRDLITLVIAVEVVSLPAFALVGLRRDDGRSAESALKFFLVSVVSTALTLFGASLLYGATGSMYLSAISEGLAEIRAGTVDMPAEMEALGAAGVLLTLAGFAFKVSAVPFHVWVPDTYVGAPLPIAAYLSVVSKAAGFAGIILLVAVGFGPYADVWAPVLAVAAALTVTVGNLVALRQRHAVRLLAWSSIAQAGFILAPLGVVAAGPGGGAGGGGIGGGDGIEAGEALSAAVAYLAIYAVMNLGAFACLAMLADDAPGHSLAEHRGIARRRPVVAGALAFFLACLAGLPPGLVGLFAKVVVFRAVIDGGGGALAVVLAVNTVIGLVYYLGWAATLFAPRPSAAATPAAATPAAGEVAGVDPGPNPAPAGRRRAPLAAGLALGAVAVLAAGLSVAPQGVLTVLDSVSPGP